MRSRSSARTASGRCSRRNDAASRGSPLRCSSSRASPVAARTASAATLDPFRAGSGSPVRQGAARSIRSGSRRRCRTAAAEKPAPEPAPAAQARRPTPAPTPHAATAPRPRRRPRRRPVRGTRTARRATSARPTSARRSSCRTNLLPDLLPRGVVQGDRRSSTGRARGTRATRWCSRSTGTSTRRRPTRCSSRRSSGTSTDSARGSDLKVVLNVSWSSEPDARSFGDLAAVLRVEQVRLGGPVPAHVQRRRFRRSAASTARSLGLYWWKRSQKGAFDLGFVPPYVSSRDAGAARSPGSRR